MRSDLNEIIFLPLAMSNLELPDFITNFDFNSVSMPNVTTYTHANGVDGKTVTNINYWSQWLVFNKEKWDTSFMSLYPDAVEVFKALPYEKLIRIYFFKQIREVDPHPDIVTGLYTDYPSAVRYWAINEELSSTFYFENGKKIFPKYPDDTKWFVMNSTAVEHGSHMPIATKIILGIYGIPDSEKFTALLDRSMERYSDYVIYKKDFE